MPKPVCVPCQRFMRPKTNDVRVRENMPVNADANPGTVEPDKWLPYKIWAADLWECRGCGAQVITGFGHGPVAEHYQPDFEKAAAGYPNFTVNDC